METLIYQVQDEIAFVTLNRPQKKNAMSFVMMKELITLTKIIQKNKNIRVVILSGSDHNFCSGIDLKDLNNPKNRFSIFWEFIKPSHSLFQEAALAWKNLSIPVIATIEGYCFGAGLQLVLAADFRITHPETQFSFMESRWGIVPDMGFSQTTQQIISIDTLKELVYTARIFNGHQAKEYGLISYSEINPIEKSLQLANEILSRSPDAIVAAKKIINTMTIEPRKTLRQEKIWQLKLLKGKNQRIAIKKDKDKNKVFKPRQYD